MRVAGFTLHGTGPGESTPLSCFHGRCGYLSNGVHGNVALLHGLGSSNSRGWTLVILALTLVPSTLFQSCSLCAVNSVSKYQLSYSDPPALQVSASLLAPALLFPSSYVYPPSVLILLFLLLRSLPDQFLHPATCSVLPSCSKFLVSVCCFPSCIDFISLHEMQRIDIYLPCGCLAAVGIKSCCNWPLHEEFGFTPLGKEGGTYASPLEEQGQLQFFRHFYHVDEFRYIFLTTHSSVSIV